MKTRAGRSRTVAASSSSSDDDISLGNNLFHLFSGSQTLRPLE